MNLIAKLTTVNKHHAHYANPSLHFAVPYPLSFPMGDLGMKGVIATLSISLSIVSLYYWLSFANFAFGSNKDIVYLANNYALGV